MPLTSLQLKKFPGALWALGAGCQRKEKCQKQLAWLGIELLPRSFVLPWDPSQWPQRCSLVGSRCWQRGMGMLPAAQRPASAGMPVGTASAHRSWELHNVGSRGSATPRSCSRGVDRWDTSTLNTQWFTRRCRCKGQCVPQWVPLAAQQHPIPKPLSPGISPTSLHHLSDFSSRFSFLLLG